MTHPALIMYKYHVWANGVIIDRLKELPQDIYHKEIQSGFLRYQRCCRTFILQITHGLTLS